MALARARNIISLKSQNITNWLFAFAFQVDDVSVLRWF